MFIIFKISGTNVHLCPAVSLHNLLIHLAYQTAK